MIMVRFTEEPVRLLIIGGLVIAAVLIWYNCCYYSEAQEIVFVKEAASVIESSGEASYSGKININTATKEQLAELEVIGDKLAQKIIDVRNQKGSFRSVDELTEVSGIGKEKFAKIKNSVTV